MRPRPLTPIEKLKFQPIVGEQRLDQGHVYVPQGSVLNALDNLLGSKNGLPTQSATTAYSKMTLRRLPAVASEWIGKLARLGPTGYSRISNP